MNRKLFSIAALLVLGLFGCAFRKEVTTAPQPSPLTTGTAPIQAKYRVKRIADGDTITVVDGQNRDVKIRFACVDAPEVPHTKQDRSSYDPADLDQFRWGERARDRLTELIEQGGDRVGLTVVDEDRYGRKVAEVRLPNGTLVQEVLAREGLAVVYRRYLNNCRSAAAVEQAEAQAKQQRAGVWGDSQFVMPSVWRHRSK
jgi:micrococcal nuclease